MYFSWPAYNLLRLRNTLNSCIFHRLHTTNSEYDRSKSIFVNSYPWLFPGGIGDIYDEERGEVDFGGWAQHLMRYYDGRFMKDQLFMLHAYDTVQRHRNNNQGSWFVNSDRFIGKTPPTVEELQEQLRNGNDKYVQQLRYYCRTLKGSDNYWRAKTSELEGWINHHVAVGHGPPTFFITLSCAENWWPDLKRLLIQTERNSNTPDGNQRAAVIEAGDQNELSKSARRYAYVVNEFFMKRAKAYMETVIKKALGIDHYWGRVEFAPGRGQIHLHLLAISKNRAYLDDFYKAKTEEEKISVIEDYAVEKLNMTANHRVNDNLKDYRANPLTSPLKRRFSEISDLDEDWVGLSQDCMMHECNDICLVPNKKSMPRVCRVMRVRETELGKCDTPGFDLRDKSKIVTDDRGFRQFAMERRYSRRMVQNSGRLLQSWRANCDIRLLLYYSDPSRPDLKEIEEVCRYVVAYTGKGQKTSKKEKEAIHNLILRYVTYCQLCFVAKYCHYMYLTLF